MRKNDKYFGSFPSAYPIAENDGLPIRPKGNMSNFKRNYGKEYKEEEGLGK